MQDLTMDFSREFPHDYHAPEAAGEEAPRDHDLSRV